MAQLVRVTEVCDRHMHAGKEVEGEVVVIGVDGVWYAVAGCKQHKARELDPIRALCEELGRKLEGDARTLKRLLKLATGADSASVHALPTASATPVIQPAEVAKSNGQVKRKGRGGKVSAKPRRHHCLWCEGDHTFTSSTGLLIHLETKHGLPKSVVDVFGLDCPLCGTHAELKLGVHMQQRHRGITVSEAFLKAKDNDKHGIAEPVFAKVPVLTP